MQTLTHADATVPSSSSKPKCLHVVAGSPPITGGYHSVLKGKHGPVAATEVYIVTTVFVRESV